MEECKKKWKIHTDQVFAKREAAKRKKEKEEEEKDHQLSLKRQKVIEERIAGEAQIQGGGTPIFSLSPDIWRMLYGMLSDDLRDIVALSRTCKRSHKYYKSLGGKKRRERRRIC